MYGDLLPSTTCITVWRGRVVDEVDLCSTMSLFFARGDRLTGGVF